MTPDEPLTPEMAASELERLRDAIDRVDEVLVRLLNQRARYAVEVGSIKGTLGLPIYVPEREQEVLAQAAVANEGPLGPDAVRRLFERIIDESRRVEREHAAEVRRVSSEGENRQ